MIYQKSLFIAVAILIAAGLVNCQRNYGSRMQKHLFDFNWKFYYGNVSNASQINFNDQNWQNMDLPHMWGNGKARQEKSLANTTAATHEKKGWYRKQFNIPEKWRNKEILIEFENLTNHAEIFLNGTYLGTSSEENASVRFSLTPLLNYSGNNVIAVSIKRTDPLNNKSENEAGIGNHVWLILKD